MKSRKYIDDLYSRLEDQKNDFRNSNLTELLLNFLKGNELLDIGCGVGYFLDKARQHGVRVWGIEPDKALIKLSKRYFGELNITEGSWRAIYKFHRKFGTIVLIDVLEHIEDDKAVMMAVNSKLCSNGRVIILVPAHKFMYGERDSKLGHVRRYSKNELVSKLEESSFRIIRIQYWNAVGVLPYIVYEKILGREIDSRIRFKSSSGMIMKVARFILDKWFKFVENNFNFGFGLSLIVVAEKLGS